MNRHIPIVGVLGAALAVCGSVAPTDDAAPRAAPQGAQTVSRAPAGDDRAADRERMVRTQIENRDVTDARVLAAMRKVPRHRFVPPDAQHRAYGDHPLAIGHDVTISQPYIVALMTQLAAVKKGANVLEVGTGSGYQAAVLHEVGATVHSIEIIKPLATRATTLLRELGYGRVHVRHGDGYAGWPEKAPFDAIVVTAAPPRVPRPLKEQLKIGGRLVIPVGNQYQELVVITRTKTGWRRRSVIPVRFVPMTGKAQTR